MQIECIDYAVLADSKAKCAGPVIAYLGSIDKNDKASNPSLDATNCEGATG